MVPSATSSPLLLPSFCSFTSALLPTNGGRVAFFPSNGFPAISSSKQHTSLRVRASSESQRDPNDSDSVLLSQEDINYLVKLGGGSVFGAAVIKYGSVLFQEITRPNITQALLIISFPVVLAVLLLIKQSRSDQED